MALKKDPVQIVEIDLDFCSLNYGESACTAVLGTTGVRKCYNSWNTCQSKNNFSAPVEPTGPDQTYVKNDALVAATFARTSSVFWACDIAFPTTVDDVCIWELGGATTGAYCGITSGNLVFRVGDGATGTPSGTAKIAESVTPFLGKFGTLYGNFDLGTSTVTLWFWNRSTREMTSIGSNTSVSPVTTWAGSGAGKIGGVSGSGGFPVGEGDGDFPGAITNVRFYDSVSASVSAPTPPVLTLRFVNPRSNLPLGATYFPVLRDVSAFSSSVNIAGTNPKLGTLGKRGKVVVKLDDFPYHDRYVDKYADERVSGTAQTDEGGYNPADRGTFWTKTKRRHPNYSGRPLRVLNGYILEDGTFSIEQTRNFIVTDITGPEDKGGVTIEAKDILTLAEKKSAIAPVPSNGALGEDITDAVGQTFTLTPEGIGESEYPTSGLAIIGSEVVNYTRVGDDITLTNRGYRRTETSSHSADDTFQVVVDYENKGINYVVNDLLSNYTDISSSFIPTADYDAEVLRWGSTTLINTTITKPTPVAELLGELSVLGVSIWWEDVGQKVKLRLNRPLDVFQTARVLTEDNAIKGMTQKDKDEERITQVHFYSLQSNPTGSVKDKGNYDRVAVYFDGDAQNTNNYGETRIKELFCRWLNTGNDSSVRIISRRFLQRFTKAPVYTNITLDAKDLDISLMDVLDVTSRVVTDDTGNSVSRTLQVSEKSESMSGHEVKIVAQAYEFDSNYGYIMENTANVFGSATDLEKSQGCYIIAEADTAFSDLTPAYRII